MVDEDRILERIRAGEDSTTEFKSVAATGFLREKKRAEKLRDAVVRSISAFANTRGGWIIFGVEDNGEVTGTGSREQGNDLLGRVTNLCHDAIEPPITCTLSWAGIRGTPVLVVEVPPFGPGRPYRGGREYYVRDGNESRLARRDELRRLLESVDYHYDEQPVPGAARSDLDEEAVHRFLAAIYPAVAEAPPDGEGTAQYLRALQCLDSAGNPTVAGVLFFARQPQQWLPDARISAVRYRGVTLSSDFHAHKEILGTLPAQVQAATGFLDEFLRSPSRVEGWTRSERGGPLELFLPREAVREALRNALMHRDYHTTSQGRVFLFDDRIEVINPGTLLNQLTLESIRVGGISQRRNPTIASLLNRVLGRETLGVGIPGMIRLMRDSGLPEPEFDLSGGHFRVVLRAKASGAP